MTKSKKKPDSKPLEKDAAKKTSASSKASPAKKTAAAKRAAAPKKVSAATTKAPAAATSAKKSSPAKSAAQKKTSTAKTGVAKASPAKASAAKASATKASPSPAKSQPAGKIDGSVAHLIHRAEQCAGDIFAQVAPSGVLTPRQFAILDAISANPGISQTGLVEQTGIDRSTLADIIRRMLEKGLVQRERTAEDARAYAVKLTRKGSDARKKMKPAASNVDKKLLEAVPKEHREMFVSVLSQMVTKLSAEEQQASTKA